VKQTNEPTITVRALSDGRFRAECRSPGLIVTASSEEKARTVAEALLSRDCRLTSPSILGVATH